TRWRGGWRTTWGRWRTRSGRSPGAASPGGETTEQRTSGRPRLLSRSTRKRWARPWWPALPRGRTEGMDPEESTQATTTATVERVEIKTDVVAQQATAIAEA